MNADFMYARVDALTASISPAVQKGAQLGRAKGAEFAWLLSLISESNSFAERIEKFAGEQPAAVEIGNYTPELVGRMNQLLAAGQRGELNMILSWLDTAPVRSAVRSDAADSSTALPSPVVQAALVGRSYAVLEEIQAARFRACA